MKFYIYTELQKKIEKSGVGRAFYHQRAALERCGITLVDSVEEADVVHINTVMSHSYAMAKKLRRENIPLVYHAHSTMEDFRNSYIGSNLVAGVFKRWITSCYETGDVIITPSEYSKSLLLNYGIKKEIFVISNGIDLDDYKRNEEAGRRFRREYGFSDDDKIIVSAGLLIKRKGVHDFVELARRCPEYKFIWFGEADLNLVGREVRHAVKTAPDNLIFGGYVGKENIKAALSGADLFLFPSYEETEGIIVLEALAMKIPVLLRNIPVYDEWKCSYSGGGGTMPILQIPSMNLRSLPKVFSKADFRRLSKEATSLSAKRASTKQAGCSFRHTNARSGCAMSARPKRNKKTDPEFISFESMYFGRRGKPANCFSNSDAIRESG